MQARLDLRRPSSAVILILFALLLSLSVGYVLKPTTVETRAARVVVVHDESALYATGDPTTAPTQACLWTTFPQYKDC